MKVDFRRLTWENYPSTETPINADNLNRLEEGVAGLYSDVAEIEEELVEGVGEYVSDWLNEHVDPVGSAVVVDDTLTIQGAAADAKKTGDELTSLKEDLQEAIDEFAAPTQEAVDNWLNAHPEATTTVQDGSITEVKLNQAFNKTLKRNFERPFKIVQISDTHYGRDVNNNTEWYNITAQERMNRIIEWLNEEHAKSPIDLIIHTGDVTFSNLYEPSNNRVDRLKEFMSIYAPQMPATVYPVMGNHDGYNDALWENATGYPKHYTVELNDMVFAIMPTFSVAESETVGGAYLENDTANLTFLRDVISKSGDKKIVLVGHYFDRARDNSEFKSIIDSNPNILFLMRGHTHVFSVGSYGNKPMVTGGNVSFGIENGTSLYDDFRTEYAWGYTVYELVSSGISVKYVQPAAIYHEDNDTTADIVFSGHTTPSTIICQGEVSSESSLDRIARKDSSGSNIYKGLESPLAQVNASFLPFGADLNDYWREGVYRSNKTALTSTILNKPNTITGGFKMVVDFDSTNLGSGIDYRHLRQTIYPANDNVFCCVRRYAPSSGWTDWRTIEQHIYGLYGSSTISSGDDLNSYTDYGTYVSATSAISASLSNTPWTTTGFKLIVERRTGTNVGDFVYQTLKPNSTLAYGYYRYYTKSSGTWSDWESLVTSKMQKTVELMTNTMSQNVYKQSDRSRISNNFGFLNICIKPTADIAANTDLFTSSVKPVDHWYITCSVGGASYEAQWRNNGAVRVNHALTSGSYPIITGVAPLQ